MAELKVHEIFRVAARELVKVKLTERGDMAKLAKAMSVEAGYLSGLFNGRRNWSDVTREKFMKFMGVTSAEMYLMGEEFLKTGHLFPYMKQLMNLPPKSMERATGIFVYTLKEFKISVSAIINELTLSHWFPKELAKYRAGELSDGAFYTLARSAVQELLSFYLPSRKEPKTRRAG